MNEYLVRTERSAWSERLTVGEVDGPIRWRFHGLGDVLRGRVATLVGLVAYFGVAFLPLDALDSFAMSMAALGLAGGLAVVIDRVMFSRYALRDPNGGPVVELIRRLSPFPARFRMAGPGGSEAELTLARKRAAIEMSGHDPIEVRGAPAEGRLDFVQRERVIASAMTWSTDARDSLTLRVEPGPMEPFVVAVAAMLDRTKRKVRGWEPPPG